MGNGSRECEWRHALEVRGGFWEIWKSQLVDLRTGHRTRRVNFRGLQRPDQFAHYRRHMRWRGGRWKSQNRKNVHLSPYGEEPLNSKVIKSFIPELRSCKCYSCFEIPMFYVYMLWTFYVCFAYSYHGYGTHLNHLKISLYVKNMSHNIKWSGLNIFPHVQRGYSCLDLTGL